MLFLTTSNFKSILPISNPSVIMNCIHFSLLEVHVTYFFLTSYLFKSSNFYDYMFTVDASILRNIILLIISNLDSQQSSLTDWFNLLKIIQSISYFCICFFHFIDLFFPSFMYIYINVYYSHSSPTLSYPLLPSPPQVQHPSSSQVPLSISCLSVYFCYMCPTEVHQSCPPRHRSGVIC